MQFNQVRAHVLNVNSKPETHGQDQVFRSDIKVEFAVPIEVIDKIVPGKNFMKQFYRGDDVILEELFPITFGKAVKDLRVVMVTDEETLQFEGVKIKDGMKWTPLSGGAVSVVATVQVYPSNAEESGRLDFLAKQWIELKVEPMNLDIEDAA